MKKRKINIQFQKNESQLNKLFDKIYIDSLELFREMMSKRFNKKYGRLIFYNICFIIPVFIKVFFKKNLNEFVCLRIS